MDSYTDISGAKDPDKKPKRGEWSKMNYIQRIGCLGLFPFYALSLFCDGRWSLIFGLMGWTSIFLGYVAGGLWKFRHVVHFWWSVAFACVVHAALLPVYARLVERMKHAPGHDGKAYMYVAFGVLIAEVLILLFALKEIALWLHRRTHGSHQLMAKAQRDAAARVMKG